MVFLYYPNYVIMPETPVALTLALRLCKSRSTDVQLAATLW